MVKKLKRILVIEKLKSIGSLVFTHREFRDIFRVTAGAASVFISRNLKAGGVFIKLRNGLYMVKDSQVSPLFIGNKLYEPSYVSLSTALSHYGIIPEVVYAVTSVTAKLPREFNTSKGIFFYQHIKKDAFTGYGLKSIDGDKVLVAEPEKALADYLYFVHLKQIEINDRLELKDIKKTALLEFVRLFKRPGMLTLVDYIYAEYKKPRKIY